MQMKILYALLFSVTMLNGLSAQMSAMAGAEGERWSNDLLRTAEKVEFTDAYRREYKVEAGRIVTETAREPINFKDATGKWKPLLTDFTAAGSEGFVAINQVYPLYVSTQGQISILPAQTPEPGFPVNKDFKGLQMQTQKVFGHSGFGEPTPHGPNGLAFVQNPSGIIKHVIFRNNALKTEFLIHQLQGLDLHAGIVEQLMVPGAVNMQKHPDLPFTYSVLDSKGSEISRLEPVVITDATGAFSTAEYEIQSRGNGRFEVRYFPNVSWMSSPERVFPITIDPLITGPTEQWVGGVMPSCLLPNFNVDSILVTIPGQITITGVFVTGSYYADPFSAAVMENGFMFFSSQCNSTPQQTVGPPNGSLPGTAYLLDIDYRNPLTCCLGQSCSQRTFWVRMHIGRNVGPNVCNSSLVYYTPTTQWPFRVFVEGRTLETAGLIWTVQPNQLCADQCELKMRPFIRYGVPPYTVTHPWSPTAQMGSIATTCAILISSDEMTLTRPNCPEYCGITTNLQVPIPSATDACGNTAAGFTIKTVNVKPVPIITVSPSDYKVCSGSPASFTFLSCNVGNTNFTWTSNGVSGSGSTVDSTFNFTGNGVDSIPFVVNAIANGCSAPPFTFKLPVHPIPQAKIDAPDAVIIFQPFDVLDSSNYFGGVGNSWVWNMGDGSPDFFTETGNHNYSQPGEYTICLEVANEAGCKDSICQKIIVLPVDVIMPNVVTPNGDGKNDLLEIPYLPFYGQSHITVLNRWGIIVYNNEDYKNDWNPSHLVDGTYYYILSLPDGKKYSSTLNIFH